jgi:phenylacetate-CoA ligase
MLYNLFIEQCVLPLVDFTRKTSFTKWLRYWRSVQRLDAAALHQLQQQKLAAILKHAAQHIPYYQSLRTQKNLHLSHFPVIYKADIKQQTDAFMWHPDLKDKLVCEKSSGSSGIQGTIYMSKEEQSKVIALQTLLWEWAGYKMGRSMLQTGITPNRSLEKRLKDILFRVRYEAAFGLKTEDILKALRSFRNKKEPVFGGYASSLYVYAQTALNNGLTDIHFGTIISWGDKLFDHYRTTIEKAFHCKVYDIYGTTEGFTIAAQKDNLYPYIMTAQVFVELLDENGKEVPDGEVGRVVVTHLDAYEMPLIRYYLGDLAVKLPESEYPEQKELGFPMFKKIIGRDTDIVRTPGGKSMVVHSFTGIFEHLPEIKQFRVLQQELSGIIIEYIPEAEFKQETLQFIEQKIISSLNERIRIDFREVSQIPHSPSGKPQLIVSTISTSQHGR